MKALVIGLVLALATPSYANEQCEALADAVYTIATQRDSGVSRREMRYRVIQRVDESIRLAFLELVDLVYQEPRHDPDTESNKFYRECISSAGTKTGLFF